MDEDRVARLLVILRAEEQLYLRLRDVLREQREVVAAMDAEALEALSRRQEELCDEARLLEQARLEVAGEVAVAAGLPRRDVRLSELCDALDTGAAALRAAHNRLVILVGVVRELLEANALLLGGSLHEVRSTLRLLGTHLPEETCYRPEGAASSETGRLVRRSA